MDSAFFDLPLDRAASESAKWRRYAPEMLPMWVADMDFRSPPEVTAAIQARAAEGIFGYPLEVDGLRAALVAWLAARHNWHIQPEWIVLVHGVVPGFIMAARLAHRQPTPTGAELGSSGVVVQPGGGLVSQTSGGLVIQPPVYHPMLIAHDYSGLQRRDAPLIQSADGSYLVDWAAFEAAVAHDSRLFLLCNPHNPTGRVFRQDELERMAEICLRHEVLICSDEIHADLVYAPHRHLPIASLDPAIARRTITLVAPSKTFNLAGLACAFAVIPDNDLRQRFKAEHGGLAGFVNIFGQVGALAAYQHGAPWLDALLAYLDGNRRWLADAVAARLPGVRLVMPESTYLAWLDCRDAGLGENPAQFFKTEARVVFEEGNIFGPGGAGFIRLNFGCPRAQLEEAVRRIELALSRRSKLAS